MAKKKVIALFNSIGNGGIERNVRTLQESSISVEIFAFRASRSDTHIKNSLNASELSSECWRNEVTLYVQNFRLLLPAIVIKILTGSKIVYHIPIGLKSGIMADYVYRFVFVLVDLIVVSTEHQKMKSSVLQNLKKCIVKPYALSKSFCENQCSWVAPKGGNFDTFGFVGRLAYQKGLDVFIDIIEALNLQGHKTLGIIYGLPSNEDDYVKRCLDRINSSDFLEFKGELDVTSHSFNEFDALLFTSRYEGYGILLAEAMLSGVPIIASNCEYGPRVISNRGNYFELIEDYENVDVWLECIKNGRYFNSWKTKQIHSAELYLQEVILNT